MKLFKLFILSLVALPSVALGMELPQDDVKSVVVVEGTSVDLSSISPFLASGIKEEVARKTLNLENLKFILSHHKVNPHTGFYSAKDQAGDMCYYAVFGVLDTAEKFVFATDYDGTVVHSSAQVLLPLLLGRTTPWYRRPTVWAATVVAGFGYYYRDSLAELVKNPAPAIEKVQSFWAQTAAPRAMSLWAGIKSVFSR